MIGPDHILVTGPMSSGTRMLCNVLAAGGLTPYHDKSHGTKANRGAYRVIAIVRAPAPTQASVVHHFHTEPIARTLSLMCIAHQYPGALWVTYEQLCAAPELTVEIIARWLGVEPWPVPFDIIDQNAKWVA